MDKKHTLLFVISVLLHLTANSQDLQWAKNYGGSNWDMGKSIDTDNKGNVYMAGKFWDTVTFATSGGNTTLRSNGFEDGFISKSDSLGNLLWVKGFGGKHPDGPSSVAVDRAGYVYITGSFSMTVDFNPGTGNALLTAAGPEDIFVAKYDTDGNFIWVRSIGGPEEESALSLALDKEANVYICGMFTGKVDFDPGPGTFFLQGQGATDAFVAVLDRDGNFKWARAMGGTGSERAICVRVGQQGNAYVTGMFMNRAVFQPDTTLMKPLTAAGGSDIFLWKLDKAGNSTWCKSLGGTESEGGMAIAIDTAGYIILSGFFSGKVDFDPGPDTFALVSGNYFDLFVLKLTMEGAWVWTVNFGSPGSPAIPGSQTDPLPNAMVCDPAGNIYITGPYQGTLDFDPGPATMLHTSSGSMDILLIKLNPDGSLNWFKSFEQASPNAISSWECGEDLALGHANSLYLTGRFGHLFFRPTIDFDPGPDTFYLTSKGNIDIFLLKLSCSATSLSVIDTTTGCAGYVLNGITYKQPGNYEQRRINAAGCDSIIQLRLTIEKDLDPVIRVDHFLLSTSRTYASYQWLKNRQPVPGANGPTYLVTENGVYSVIVSDLEGCTDTAAEYEVTNVTHIRETSGEDEKVNIFPNPAGEILYIYGDLTALPLLYSMDGRKIEVPAAENKLYLNGVAPGIYYLILKDKDGHQLRYQKIVKL